MRETADAEAEVGPDDIRGRLLMLKPTLVAGTKLDQMKFEGDVGELADADAGADGGGRRWWSRGQTSLRVRQALKALIVVN